MAPKVKHPGGVKTNLLGRGAGRAKTVNLLRGSRLRKYRLAACLGKGGSSEVWKARDCVEGIWVALKIPILDVNGARDNKALLHEIRLVSQLRHKHIMPVKNADIINGHVVLATELSAGTLDDRSRPMSTRKIVSVILQVLEGLAYAHQRRLVHCDVTPGNIFFLPDKRAALGDFGISLHLKGRMVTSDVFGTPGYVAPEQAYGYPTCRSDCFAVALILYEFITGVLPRWPFKYPFKGHNRLRSKTGANFVSFMRKALSVNPDARFSDASEMLNALKQALPKKLINGMNVHPQERKKFDWKKTRQQAFLKRYGKIFPSISPCVDCHEPIAESMWKCPWCGSERNTFTYTSQFNYLCPDCKKSVLPEWRFCPWCYGKGFDCPSDKQTAGVRYHSKCKSCNGKLMRFMRYCPWCHVKVRKPSKISVFPEICTKCKEPVDSSFWIYCPWCKQSLI